jgi:hypothetical protein
MKTKRISALLLTLALALSLTVPAAAQTTAAADALTDTAACTLEQVKNPQIGYLGGEWAILGLVRGGCTLPALYCQRYYKAVETQVIAKKGVLDAKKNTEFARVILGLTAIGKNPADVAGYNLLTPLGDYDKTLTQGVMGPIYALLALDSGSYAMPENKTAATQATRQMYVDYLLKQQLTDGGWNYSGKSEEGADPDVTGMVLQALAKYQDQTAVKTATDKALLRISAMQLADGGFSSWGTESSESAAQILVALTELGISTDDSRFVKNGKSAVDNLLTFWRKGSGFLHAAGDKQTNEYSTEQALYGLAAVQRAAQKQSSLYRMEDAKTFQTVSIKVPVVTMTGATFGDITKRTDKAAIETLASRGILNGKTATVFAPGDSMTRAEFTAVIVRALGLAPTMVTQFTDVKNSSWYAGYVGAAYLCGIINGVSATSFRPGGTITRQQAAAMVARAAALCGMNTAVSSADAAKVLSRYSDASACAAWAIPSLAFCTQQGILDGTKLRPQSKALRGEVAQMVCNLLTAAKLL